MQMHSHGDSHCTLFIHASYRYAVRYDFALVYLGLHTQVHKTADAMVWRWSFREIGFGTWGGLVAVANGYGSGHMGMESGRPLRSIGISHL